jgi:hypothetical protein
MPRVALDLNKAEDRQKVQGQWRVAPGLVPGEPNEGLTAQLPGSPARLADYNDSGWEVCTNIRESLSVGFTFAWYRIAVTVPEQLDGVQLAGSRVWFETNIDNYGEIWIDGKIDRATGVIVGINAQHRVEVSGNALPDRSSGGRSPTLTSSRAVRERRSRMQASGRLGESPLPVLRSTCGIPAT